MGVCGFRRVVFPSFANIMISFLAESDDGKTYMVYNRWGRVGVKGQTKLHGPFTSQQAAIIEFESKFFDKTKNYWSNRKDFVCYPKYYTLLEMAYEENHKQSDVSCFKF